jgi:hypothetical protein
MHCIVMSNNTGSTGVGCWTLSGVYGRLGRPPQAEGLPHISSDTVVNESAAWGFSPALDRAGTVARPSTRLFVN